MKKLFWLYLLAAFITLSCQLPQQLLPSRDEGTSLTQPTSTEVLPTDSELILPTPEPTPTTNPQNAADTPEQGGVFAEAERAVFIGDWPAALAGYQAALNSALDQDTQSGALAGLGRVYFRSGEDYNALQAMERLLEAYPDSIYSAEAYYIIAAANRNLNRPLEAAAAYLDYLQLNPGIIDFYIYSWRGDALVEAGDYQSALNAYQTALSSPHLVPDLDLEIKLAQAYVLTGDTATASVLYADIYQRSTADYQKAKVDLLLGQLYASLGQIEQAHSTWLDAVNLFPTTYDAYQCLVELVNAGYPVDELQRGIVDYNVGEYGVALAALERYLAEEPAEPDKALYYRGLSLRAIGDSNSAVEVWEFALRNYPQTSSSDLIHEQLAYTQWAFLDQYAEAWQTLIDFVDSNPLHPRGAEFLFDAAQIAERSGDYALAAQLWSRLVADYPTAALAFESSFKAGISDFRRGDYPSAQAQFMDAYQIAGQPEDRARSYFWVAKTYLAVGDTNAAQSFWLQTAEMDPTGYYSERARDLSEGRSAFEPPQIFDLGFDPVVERQEAETWLIRTFSLPEGINLSSQGDLPNDGRLQRGLALWRLGEHTHATAEIEALRIALQSDPVGLFRLLDILLENSIIRPAIMAARQILNLAGMDDASTLFAPMYFNRIRFGNYYADLVFETAREYDFHPLFVWSVIRQESLFDANISSSAGARGLMQIIPSTGQDIAKRLGWPPEFTPDDLLRPQVSIRMGVDYLSNQRAYLENDLYAALAGYNAGPGNAAIWHSLAPHDPDLFLEIVRFSEPQRYIKGIYEIFSIYRKLFERIP